MQRSLTDPYLKRSRKRDLNQNSRVHYIRYFTAPNGRCIAYEYIRAGSLGEQNYCKKELLFYGIRGTQADRSPDDKRSARPMDTYNTKFSLLKS